MNNNNPLIDENPMYNLEYLLEQLIKFTKENTSVSFKILTDKKTDLNKITLRSDNNENVIIITDNGNTNDFYHVKINDNEVMEDLPLEELYVWIEKYFPVESSANVMTFEQFKQSL